MYSPTVSIIGAGKLGTALALALVRCGYRIDALVTLRERTHKDFPARLARARLLTAAELDQLPGSDIIFITTGDDQIAPTAAALANCVTRTRKRRVALHASGALGASELSSLRDHGFSVAALHPLISVSAAQSGSKALPRAYFCIEGDNLAIKSAREIVSALGAKHFSVTAEHKALYHAAAVMACGHVVALLDTAAGMLTDCGVPRALALQILLPLLETTIANLAATDATQAMTGTFARGDIETVKRHLRAIRAGSQADALAIYKALGLHALNLASRDHVSAHKAAEIRRLVNKP